MKGYSENYWAKRAKQYNKTNWVKNKIIISPNSFSFSDNSINGIMSLEAV